MASLNEVLLLTSLSLLGITTGTRDLSASYPFKATLNTEKNGGLYELYWTFDNAEETISFAVRVQTEGWIGFGLSPNGKMPGSDVVIGWVDGNGVFLHDRFAPRRSVPPIDDQQDWILKTGEEEDGFTTLEFSRKYITCDDKDLPIEADTAQVIWSFYPDDPSSTAGSDPVFTMRHTYQGGTSLNLLGGLVSIPPDPVDLKTYDVKVDDIVIPARGTTYWCIALQLPENIRKQRQYITKYSPIVTEGNEAHVHHLLIYLCDALNNTHVGDSGKCDSGVSDEVMDCRGGNLIAGWAIGGETFRYPENVAYPFGGPNSSHFVVMELHYDNPDEITGTQDNSGIRFFYTSTPREYDAGILELGHHVTPFMIIPPNRASYTVAGVCAADCTNKHFPDGGINIFANLLHTHLVGYGLILQHFRNTSECGGYEELPPIETNLRYDSDYQQFNQLPNIRTVLPGDILVLKCFYRTEDEKNFYFGYYPRSDLHKCLSSFPYGEFFKFLYTNLPESATAKITAGNYEGGLNSVDWTDEMVQALQNTTLNGSQYSTCSADISSEVQTEFPEVKCPYVPPETCLTSTGSATTLSPSVLLALLLLLAMAVTLV